MWSFDHTLAGLVLQGVRRLRQWNNGHPADLTEADWLLILDQMEAGFGSYFEAECRGEDYDREAFELALNHLSNRFRDLWD